MGTHPNPPTALARGWRRLVFRWRRDRLYRDLAEEIESHRRLKEAGNRREGLTPQAARELSRRQMGNIAIAQEVCRDMWSFVKLERLFEDLRFAARLFRRTPAFTSIAVLSLAIGIGGNTAMFSLVDKLLVQPLPYPAPDRLVRVTGIYPRAAVPVFQRQSRTMDVAAVSAGSDYNLTGQGEAVRILGSAVSANLFSVLGAPVARGRSFKPGEDLPGRDSVAILSDSLWKTQFGADPAIVGRAIRLNGVSREIVGIMPPGFSYPTSKVEAWVPLRLDPSNFLEYWGGEFVPLVGRVRSGAGIPQAQGEARAMAAQFNRMFPYPMPRDFNAGATAISLHQDLAGDIRGKLIILLSCVGMVLLIACANVASLLLSRAMTRRKEIALRVALGAGRFRIVRQLLTESVLLALAGGGLGILLGASALSIFKSVLPATMPGLSEAAIDWQVAGAAAALSLFTGLAFGLAPALSASRVDLASSIKTGSQRSAATAWTRLRSWLIAAEVALTVVLVVSAGLLMRSLYSLSEAHPGGVGLTTAVVALRSGFVIVGSLPTSNGMAATAEAGCLIVPDRNGKPVATLSGNGINGPWDMTAVDFGGSAVLFVTNVLNGTVKANGTQVNEGTVLRILLSTPSFGAPRELARTVIASGFPEVTDPNALVIGPTGLGLSADGRLFVADTIGNRIAAIADALFRPNSAGSGATISQGGALNGPLGAAIAPNGDILTVNSGDGNMVELTPGGEQIAKKAVDVSNQGAGTLFGLAIAPNGQGVYFVDDGNNTLNLLH